MQKNDPGRRGKQPPERGILDAMEDLESKRGKKADKPTPSEEEPDDQDDDLDLDRIW